ADELKLALPDLPWHSHRDRVAEVATTLGLLVGTLGKIARDISLHMQTDVDLHEQARLYSDAAGLLLDTYVPGIPGGSGQTFDWSRIPPNFAKPIIVAGGLTAQNVAEVIKQAHPFAVDVSSGVELTKGVKDAQKIAAFIDAVRKAA
ncbi:MAG: hypothetical protein HY081_04095, partial [Gammaproteobacteria bacterium]|nr:hypothetical protein [Gammaproteobacteria bacterium]